MPKPVNGPERVCDAGAMMRAPDSRMRDNKSIPELSAAVRAERSITNSLF